LQFPPETQIKSSVRVTFVTPPPFLTKHLCLCGVQILSEKSAMEQKVFRTEAELIGANKLYSSEKKSFDVQIANMTSQIRDLNEKLHILESINKTATSEQQILSTQLQQNIDSLNTKLSEMTQKQAKDTLLQEEKARREQEMLKETFLRDKATMRDRFQRDREKLEEKLRNVKGVARQTTSKLLLDKQRVEEKFLRERTSLETKLAQRLKGIEETIPLDLSEKALLTEQIQTSNMTQVLDFVKKTNEPIEAIQECTKGIDVSMHAEKGD
jgi:hypothetical protein